MKGDNIMTTEILFTDYVEGNGFRQLPTFKGYTIDVRCCQFRKAVYGETLEFIDFDTEDGKEMIQELVRSIPTDSVLFDEIAEMIHVVVAHPCLGCGEDRFQRCLEDGTISYGLLESRSADEGEIYYYRCTSCECAYTVEVPDGVVDIKKATWEPRERPATRCPECQERIELKETGYCCLCERWVTFTMLAYNPSLPKGDRVARVNGHHYFIGDEVDKSLPGMLGMRGFRGQQFSIKFLDGREVTTTNLWYQGEIPKRFRGRLPDNAEFIGETPMAPFHH
jgi:hypothetical protein